MNSLPKLAVLLAVGAPAAATALACQGERHGDVPRVVVSDSAGVEIVDNRIAPGDAPAVALAEELRIGSVEGPPETQLDLVRRIAVSPNGNIHVALLRANQIRIFGADGVHLRTLGGSGQGPGEFSRLSTIWLLGDTVVALDMGLLRITSLTPGGEVLGTAPLSRDESGFVTPLAPFGDGWLVDVPEPWEWPDHGRALERRSAFVAAPAREAGAALRLVEESAPGVRRVLERSWGTSFGMDQAGVPTMLRPLWEPGIQPWASDGQGRVYVTARDEYRIDVLDEHGAPIRRIGRTHRPVPVTADLKRRYLEHVTAHHDTVQVRTEFGVDPVEIERYRAALPGPDHVPALGALIAARDGALLVERRDLVDDPVALEWTSLPRGSSRWDLFGPDGAFTGTVTFPPRFIPHVLLDDRVLGVLRDELGVEYVVRYRMAPE